MMKILLFGKHGQLGWELQRALSPLGEIYALDRKIDPAYCGELGDLKGIANTVRSLKPDLVVNAAAYTAVDKAEVEPDLAKLINSQAPAVLAEEVAKLDAWLIHYSSDYVFDGSGTQPWQESDKPAPLNRYGRSKLAGEEAIQASGCKHLIFRTSWVYGAYGHNFIKTILRLAREREKLTIVADQVGVPTGADFLADLSVHAFSKAIAKPEISGLYHLVPRGKTSWYEYAHFVVEHAKNLGAKLIVDTITAIQSANYSTPAQRPLNSQLATAKFSETFSLHLPYWELGVVRMLDEILRISS